MNIATIIGILLGLGSLIAGFVLGGGSPGALALLGPAVIVLGGTAGVSVIAFQHDLKNLPRVLSKAFRQSGAAAVLRDASELREIASIAKTNGLWGLEPYIKDNPQISPAMHRGIMMLMDGADSKRIGEAMKAEFNVTEKSRISDIAMLESIGKYSAAMGIIGALLSLLLAAGNINTALLWTDAAVPALYGAVLCWVICMPFAGKLKTDLKVDDICHEMQARVLSGLQDGLSPREVGEVITPYLEAAGVSPVILENEF